VLGFFFFGGGGGKEKKSFSSPIVFPGEEKEEQYRLKRHYIKKNASFHLKENDTKLS